MSDNAFMTEEELKELETPIDPDADEAELDAIANGKEGAEAEAEAQPKGEAGDQPKDEPADPPKDQAGEEDAPAPTDAPAGEAPAPAQAPAAAPAGAYVEPQIPVVVPPVENYEAKVKELEDKLDAATRAYENGEGDLDEAGLRALERQTMREIGQLDTQQAMHLRTSELARQTDVDAWSAAFERFSSAPSVTKEMDYRDETNFQALVRAVSFERSEAKAAGEQLTRAQILERAHRTLLVRMGKAPAAGDAPNPKPKPRENPPGPKTLAHMPAAVDTAASHAKDDFAYMDALDDEAREIAYEKLSEADKLRYLNGS